MEEFEKEIEVYFYRSRGPGGQRKNKKNTAVKIIHKPTGIVVRATEFRYQALNKKLALERLRKKLEELNKKKKVRIKTEKPPGVKLKQIEDKRRRSEKKKLRKKISPFF